MQISTNKSTKNNTVKVTIEHSASNYNEDQDSWEGTLYEAEESFGVSGNFTIKYTDSKGLFSERELIVRNAGTINGKKAIFGYCKLRNQSRTFIINQISECVDLDTGEFIKDIYSYLQNKYENSPEKALYEVETNEKDILNVLAFIGRADGQFRKEEKQIICDAVIRLSGNDKINHEVIIKALGNYGDNSIQSFKLAIGRISLRPEKIKQLVSDTAKQIVGTQKIIHPSEQEALDYINKKFYSK
jgi:hypothetical protein